MFRSLAHRAAFLGTAVVFLVSAGCGGGCGGCGGSSGKSTPLASSSTEPPLVIGPGSSSPIPPSSSPPPPAPVVPGDGRTPVVAGDLKKAPYCYVGRLINAKNPTSWGTGILVGPRHVLTAAHVVEHLAAHEKASGAATFVLPDGRSSLMGDAELDGGWRDKIATCDFGILTLDDDLGKGGLHASWMAFDDEKLIGNVLHITGYDADMWVAAGRPAQPYLYDRTTPIAGFTKYAADYTFKASVIFGGGAVVGSKIAPKAAPAFWGVAALGVTYYALKGNFLDGYGWSADSAVQAVGASGGPLWIDDGGIPKVVGITGHAFYRGESHGQPFGRPVGSKITPGATDDMIRNFIKTHP